MSSIAIILVISLFLLGNQSNSRTKVTRDWLNSNLYKVQSYEENKNGTYYVQLLTVSGPDVKDFRGLRDVFFTTPYSNFNGDSLDSGVNCQGMTYYIATWCEENQVEFKVVYSPTHVVVDVKEDGVWYRYDFSEEPTVTAVD